MFSPQLFPLAARVNNPRWKCMGVVNAAQHLELGGCDVVELAREFGTPLYVFDDATLRDHAARARDTLAAQWQNSRVLYATKAGFSPFLARLYRDLGLGLDVTSEGELEIARRVNFPPDRIYLHGNNKTSGEIRAALALGVTHYIVDNLDEISLLAQLADRARVTPRVLLRLTPNVDPHTHQYLTTGIVESKFGMTPNTARSAIERIRKTNLELVGLHFHIGSQVFELDAYRAAIFAALEFAAQNQIVLHELDLGGGWGVAYTTEQTTIPIEEIIRALVQNVRDGLEHFQSPISNLCLLVEPGRALIARSALAVYTVGAVKVQDHARVYVSVDGGMGDNIRPALYGAKYSACVANKMLESPSQRVAVAGRYCEQGDVLIWDAELPRVVPGDLIAIPVAGAYQLPMASNYNLIPRPAVVLVRDGSARLIRRRETIEDMLRCEME